VHQGAEAFGEGVVEADSELSGEQEDGASASCSSGSASSNRASAWITWATASVDPS
jgi:hypothetical protein